MEEKKDERMPHIKNRLFLKNGHDCDYAYDLDKVSKYVPDQDIKSIMKRAYLRKVVISETNKSVEKYYRSQGAIALEKNRQLRRHFFIIHPFSDIRQWWESLMMLVFFGQFIMIPLDLSFLNSDLNVDPKAWVVIRFVLDIICLVDIGMSFLTGYYDNYRKKIVLTPQIIAIHFLRTYFVPDLLSSIPSRFIFLENPKMKDVATVTQVIALLKFVRFQTFVHYCNRTSKNVGVSFYLHNSLLIIICYGLYFHFVCCILHFLNNVNSTEEGMGLDYTMSKESLILRTYILWFYRGCMVITNSNYGDHLPRYHVNAIALVVFFILSRLVQIYLISRIAELITARTSASHKYVEMVRQLREYMRHKQLPEHVQRRLVTYYEFRFQKSYFRESEILNTISGQLRQDIVMSSCRKLVENVGFFKNLPLGLLVRIVSSLHSEVFLTNDVIVRANTPGNSMYFISTGTVAVFTNSGKEVCHLHDGDHFGEIALVMPNKRRVASVVAVEICEVFCLGRREFVKAIYPYPDLLESIERIAADRVEQTQRLDEIHRRETLF